MKNLEINYNLFEKIKHKDENGNEYWNARELMPLLEYSKWERFSNIIDHAKTSCIKSGYDINDHFPKVGKMVQIGSKTKRKLIGLSVPLNFSFFYRMEDIW